MKWTAINNSFSVLQEFCLQEFGDNKLTVKYNPGQQSVRVQAATLRRLFFIRSAGSLGGRYMLRNEYGVDLGWMQEHRSSNRMGQLQLEANCFDYSFSEDRSHLTIIDNRTGRQLLQVAMPSLLHAAGQPISQVHVPCLLLATCWLLALQQQIAKAEYAA